MRGMVFGADSDRLIVQATPEDVRRYTRGESVLVHGMTEPRGAGLPFTPTGEEIMIAMSRDMQVHGCVLQTADGCVRYMAVTGYPPPEIRVSLYRSTLLRMETPNMNDRVDVNVRVYRLHEHMRQETMRPDPNLGRWRNEYDHLFRERREWFLYREVM